MNPWLWLYLFLDPAEGWQPVSDVNGAHAFDTAEGETRPHLSLRTTGDGILFAPVNGVLSTKPPGFDDRHDAHNLLNLERSGANLVFGIPEQVRSLVRTPHVDEPRPDTVRLFLHADWPLHSGQGQGLFRWQDALSGYPLVTSFAFFDVETATLEDELGIRLDRAELIGLPIEQLRQHLGNDADIQDGRLIRARKLGLLLAGLLQVRVPAGARIGRAAPLPGDGGTRGVGFAALSAEGAVDPVTIYEHRAPFVRRPPRPLEEDPLDTPSPLDQLTQLAGPSTWPNFSSTSIADLVAETTATTFPFPVLREMRRRLSLTPQQWRALGDRQKALYLARLRARSPIGEAEDDGTRPFDFQLLDWANLFQLEAVAEFYLNCIEPWSEEPEAIEPGTALSGDAAEEDANGSFWTRLSVEAGTDLSNVRPNIDLLRLIDDDERPAGLYHVIDVDDAANTITVEGRPSFEDSSAWRIELYQTVTLTNPAGLQARLTHGSDEVELLDGVAHELQWIRVPSDSSDNVEPDVCDWLKLSEFPEQTFEIVDFDPEAGTLRLSDPIQLPDAGDDEEGELTSAWEIRTRAKLVHIEPFGPRSRGHGFTVDENEPRNVTLPGEDDRFQRVNINFDTLHIPGATGRKTFRIMAVDDTTLTLHEAPQLDGEPGDWQICCGVTTWVPPYYYVLGPTWLQDRGDNHYEGMLFTVADDRVRGYLRYTSYTSRNYGSRIQGGSRHPSLSSVRGNMRYDLRSFRATTSADQNFTVQVRDSFARRFGGGRNDLVREAGWYYEYSPTDDPDRDPFHPVPADRTPPTRNDQGPGPAYRWGKTAIRLHWSGRYRLNRGARSAGCITSPSHATLREILIEAHQEERIARGLQRDALMDRVLDNARDQNAARTYYRQNLPSLWRWKLVGSLLLVRTEQPPTRPHGQEGVDGL